MYLGTTYQNRFNVCKVIRCLSIYARLVSLCANGFDKKHSFLSGPVRNLTFITFNNLSQLTNRFRQIKFVYYLLRNQNDDLKFKMQEKIN
jgi:hypothetical protein